MLKSSTLVWFALGGLAGYLYLKQNATSIAAGALGTSFVNTVWSAITGGNSN